MTEPVPGEVLHRVRKLAQLREAARDQAEKIVVVPGDIVSVEPTRKTMVMDGLKYRKYIAFGAMMIGIRASVGGL